MGLMPRIRRESPAVPSSSFLPVADRPMQHDRLGPVRDLGDFAEKPLVMPPPLQAKLVIGEPNDRYEQEADLIADRIMQMPEARIQRKPT